MTTLTETEERSYHPNGASRLRETPPAATAQPAFSARSVAGQPASIAQDQSQGARLQAQGPKGLSNSDLTALLLWNAQEWENVSAMASCLLAKQAGRAGT